MAPGAPTFDLWERDEHRLLVGGTFTGLGCLFGLGLHQLGEPGEPAPALWFVCLVAALGIIPGVLILAVERRVSIDPARRQLTRTRFPLCRRLRSRTWPFDHLSAVSLRHEATGDDTFATHVGIRPANAQVIWLRAFPASAETPAEAATALAQRLAVLTGLPVETETR